MVQPEYIDIWCGSAGFTERSSFGFTGQFLWQKPANGSAFKDSSTTNFAFPLNHPPVFINCEPLCAIQEVLLARNKQISSKLRRSPVESFHGKLKAIAHNTSLKWRVFIKNLPRKLLLGSAIRQSWALIKLYSLTCNLAIWNPNFGYQVWNSNCQIWNRIKEKTVWWIWQPVFIGKDSGGIPRISC